MAAFVRSKKLPSLKSILRERSGRVSHQSPQEQRIFFLEFARRAGLKVERHEKPVIQYPVM